jgi:hypothetical protein
MINEALDEASVLILLVSEESLRSKWVEYEWRSFNNDILDRPEVLSQGETYDCTGVPAPVCNIKEGCALLSGHSPDYFSPQGKNPGMIMVLDSI